MFEQCGAQLLQECRQAIKRRAVAQCPGFALDQRDVMPPVVASRVDSVIEQATLDNALEAKAATEVAC